MDCTVRIYPKHYALKYFTAYSFKCILKTSTTKASLILLQIRGVIMFSVAFCHLVSLCMCVSVCL